MTALTIEPTGGAAPAHFEPDDDALLTADEEIWLGRAILAAKSAAATPIPSTLDRGLFLEVVRYRAQGARNRLVQQNLRLVYREAIRYRGFWLDLADLVQEGCIGLLQAAERYDPDRGVRFSTYAVPWIRQAVDRASKAHRRLVRIPRTVDVSSGDDPDAAPRPDLLPPASLDVPSGVPGSETLAESLADPSADPERDAIHSVLLESLGAALSRCPRREREVIVRRYGLAGCTPQSHEAIAGDLGVCRERVRQIEASALRRLRLSEGLTDLGH
ncbi:MAG: sigma-70 family RNA polymerase sigma factor [Dehalococcoidia bacterium]